MSEDTRTQVTDLEHRAIDARRRGEYEQAAQLFDEAAALADTVERRLHLMMRAAHSHTATGNREPAEAIARLVAEEARAEFLHAELADALGLLVASEMIKGELAEATRLLAEAMYVMGLVPDVPENYQIVHNMADTYRECHFAIPALELLERALALATSESDRTFTLANIAAAHHMAMNFEQSPDRAAEHLRKGIEAANGALAGASETDVLTRITALAHRSVLLNGVGQHEQALADALEARQLADLHSVGAEESVAMVGEVVARWNLHRDPTVVDLIAAAVSKSRGRGTLPYMKAAAPVTVDILWSQGRYAEARAVLGIQHAMLLKALHREREARWQHVRLGVSYRATEALSESDPLTGLPNRRYLGHWLPEVLDEQGIACVAVLDLDSFKQVNDLFSYAHGDSVLQELAVMLQRMSRRGDAVVRLGGDEFVLVLRDISPGDARAVLERVRRLIAVTSWDGLPANHRLTASVGVSVGSGASDAAHVLASAHEALRIAKRSGRDLIVFR